MIQAVTCRWTDTRMHWADGTLEGGELGVDGSHRAAGHASVFSDAIGLGRPGRCGLEHRSTAARGGSRNRRDTAGPHALVRYRWRWRRDRTATIAIQVIPQEAGTLTNTAVLGGSDYLTDPVPDNNTATVEVTVLPRVPIVVNTVADVVDGDPAHESSRSHRGTGQSGSRPRHDCV